MIICNNCGARHEQPGIDYSTTVPSSILEKRGEQDIDKCRECGSDDLEKGEQAILARGRKTI